MKICITGGGTGGHLMIAEALEEAALREGHEIIFIGSTSGQDRKYFAQDSHFSDLYFLETTGVVNQKGLGKIKALAKVFRAFLQAKKILQEKKIDAVYSVGGFSAAPASFAAIFSGVPLFIHEQNAVEGRLNAILKRYAKSFISAYDANSPIQGYPVKEIFYEKARVRKSFESIIFLGGSHGAKAINELALSVAKELQEMGIKIIHQAGEFDFERVKKAYEEMGIEVELYGFTKDLSTLITKADLAISRAGASTLWELTANGCPALFIPYPYAAGDHQYHNAHFIVEHNLGWCARESENLVSVLMEIVKEPKIQEKSEKLLKYSKKGVALEMIRNMELSL